MHPHIEGPRWTGIPYQLINVAADPPALEHVRAAGFLQAPVVEGAGEAWAGFRPDRISELVKERAL